jgi:hypothetical protein
MVAILRGSRVSGDEPLDYICDWRRKTHPCDHFGYSGVPLCSGLSSENAINNPAKKVHIEGLERNLRFGLEEPPEVYEELADPDGVTGFLFLQFCGQIAG